MRKSLEHNKVKSDSVLKPACDILLAPLGITGANLCCSFPAAVFLSPPSNRVPYRHTFDLCSTLALKAALHALAVAN